MLNYIRLIALYNTALANTGTILALPVKRLQKVLGYK